MCVSGNCSCPADYAGPSYTAPPSLVCPNDTVISNGEAVHWKVPTATDGSGEVYLLSTHSIGDYFPLGNTTVSYTAVDKYGLQTTCSFLIEIIPDTAPSISNCPSNQLVGASDGATSVIAVWTPPTAVDPDGGTVMVTSDFEPGASFPLGTTEVTYVFTDDAGESSQCVFRVKVEKTADTTPPQLVTPCPADIIEYVLPGIDQATVTWTEPSFIDVVDGTDLYTSQTHQPGTNFPTGSTQVLYVAMDKSYNPSQCSFTVIVNETQDASPPEFDNCPSNITRWVATGTTQATVSWTPPNATDEYGTPVVVASVEPGSSFGLGSVAVEYTATDTVGNTAVCLFIVTVAVDDEAPVVTGCPGNIVEYVPVGVISLPVTWSSPTVTDNSGQFTTQTNLESGFVFQASLTRRNDRVTMTYADNYGNSAVCTFTVSVLIDTAPVFTCPATITRDNGAGQDYADVSWPEITVSDDYTGQASLQITMTHSEPLRVYYHTPVTVTYTATDVRGNTATCVFTVVVQDAEPPVLQDCPSDITQPLDQGTNSAIVRWDEPTASDNSGVAPTITSTASNPELFFAGTYTVRYVASDEATPPNTAECEFTVTITVDQAVPVFDNCPVGTLNFVADEGTSSATVTWPTITATDDEDPNVDITSNYQPGVELELGSYDVEYQAMDSAGNIGYCGFVVEVIDLEPPFISPCPDDQTLYVANAISDVRALWSTPGATDNSGRVTITRPSGRASGSRFPVGTSTILYVAEDPSGNFAVCSFVIFVEVKQSTIALDGQVTMDVVRGLQGVFAGSYRQRNLQDDVSNYFSFTSLAADFVGVQITSSRFDNDDNYVVGFLLIFCASSHYNEEGIKDIFLGALTGPNGDSFATSNVVLTDTFDLNVVEFRGQFTLKSIETPGTVPVDFQACCSDPTSSSYLSLSDRIYDHFERVYGSQSPFRMSHILFLSPGSIVVEYTLTYDPTDAPSTVEVREMFDDSVTPVTLELVEGVSTGLYLEIVEGATARSVQAICPSSGYCFNGGSCSVVNSTTYDVACSCVERYYGPQCQYRGLSIEAIIAIAIGGAIFVLVVILVAACCCYVIIFADASEKAEKAAEKVDRQRRRRRERLLRRLHRPKRAPPNLSAPLIPAPSPVDDFQFANGVFVHEINETQHKTKTKGPSFLHEGQNGFPPPPPPPLFPSPPQSPAFQFQHEKNAAHSPTAGRKQKAKGRGPKFNADKPEGERVTLQRNLEEKYLRKQQKQAKHGTEKKKREKGPSFHGNDNPEPVLEMKQRMFHEFSY
ncbi:hyalin-like [Diadema antillarum]|uniref:hyalin-like n=1 Tax=Diadema antillarum TaxID=105358 RepID=UPI003A846F9E